MKPLSYREGQVLRRRRKGMLFKQIAYQLGISLSRVRNCLDRADAKGAKVPRMASWRRVR